MARKKQKYLTMTVHNHGIGWWLLVGWWWRPIKYLFWRLLCAVTGRGLKKRIIRVKRMSV